AANSVRITGLSDVSLPGLDPSVDAISSQNICVYSSSATSGYNVTVTGSGAGSAYALNGGSGRTLPFIVQCADSTGKTTGTQLQPGTTLTGQISSATQQRCTNGPSSSASLIVRLKASDLQSATAGISYSGTLTIVIAPE